MSIPVTWYRAMCFDRAIGPWRQACFQAIDDLIAEGLGSVDTHGRFFITVPGEIQRLTEWMSVAEARPWVEERRELERARKLTFERRARSRGRPRGNWCRRR